MELRWLPLQQTSCQTPCQTGICFRYSPRVDFLTQNINTQGIPFYHNSHEGYPPELLSYCAQLLCTLMCVPRVIQQIIQHLKVDTPKSHGSLVRSVLGSALGCWVSKSSHSFKPDGKTKSLGCHVDKLLFGKLQKHRTNMQNADTLVHPNVNKKKRMSNNYVKIQQSGLEPVTC